MLFNKPESLNGATLIKELAAVGVNVSQIIVDGNNNLDLDVNAKDKEKVENVLSSHDGSDIIPDEVLLKKSAINKLIDLGLTEDEAKAFLG